MPEADTAAAEVARRLNGLSMPDLLAELAAKDRQWIFVNRDALVGTPGVGPKRMALAVEAVLAGREASDERLAAMMGEMQAMGLPEDQQAEVARFCGAFGLRAPAILDAYVAGASALQPQWASLSAEARAQKLGELAGASLVQAGVPAPLGVDVVDIQGGEWDPETWRIRVSRSIGTMRLDPGMFAKAAATIYHEARHGEQDFLSLRTLAGQNPDPAAVGARLKAPAEIVAAACRAPLPASDPRARKAAEWLGANPDLAYMDRPVERDAHATGNTVVDRVNGGTPPDRSSQLRDPWIPNVAGSTAARVARRSARLPVLARAPETAPSPTSIADAIKSGDPDALKPLRPFGRIGPGQLREICRLVIDKNTWIGPDDEKTLEEAWKAAGPEGLTDADWKLWKECEDYGAEVKLVPWLYELRTTFAERVRSLAVDNLDANVGAVQAEATRLGIGLGGEAQPAPTAESDAAVAKQRELAFGISALHDRQKQLREIPVGWQAPSWGGGSAPGGIPDEAKKPALFDPEHPPHEAPAKEDGMADHAVMKAVDDSITASVGKILGANPALYALTAREGSDTLMGKDVGEARAAMTKGLGEVVVNAASTRADVISQSLGFEQLVPVHGRVFASDAKFGSGFAKSAAQDYVNEEAGADAAAGKVLSLLTIALIATVEVATVGGATPVIGAIISLTASGAAAASSWADWSKLETAAKASSSDGNAVVSQDQSDAALLGAVMATAMVLIDAYGVGKAVKGANAASKAAAEALEGRVKNAATLRPQLAAIGRGEVVKDAPQVMEESCKLFGEAAALRQVGTWGAAAKATGPGSTAMQQLGVWRQGLIRGAEAEASQAARGAESEAARRFLAVAAGVEQAAVGEVLDLVIEVSSGPTDAEATGAVGMGGKQASIDVDALIEDCAKRWNLPLDTAEPAPVTAKLTPKRRLARVPTATVEVPFSASAISRMSPADFEEMLRTGTAAGHMQSLGLPRMTVIDGKIHGGGHGWDGLGISKEGNRVNLYQLEAKHVVEGSPFAPELHSTRFGDQGSLTWSEAKVRQLLAAENEVAEETLASLHAAMRRRVRGYKPEMLADSLAGAIRTAKFVVMTPVWAKEIELLAKLRGLERSGVSGMLIRIAPKGFGRRG